LQQEIEAEEKSRQALLEQLASSQAKLLEELSVSQGRLERLRKQKVLIDKKSDAQSAAVEAELLEEDLARGGPLVEEAGVLEWPLGSPLTPSAFVGLESVGSPSVSQGN
jgi:hypothetical protein